MGRTHVSKYGTGMHVAGWATSNDGVAERHR